MDRRTRIIVVFVVLICSAIVIGALVRRLLRKARHITGSSERMAESATENDDESGDWESNVIRQIIGSGERKYSVGERKYGVGEYRYGAGEHKQPAGNPVMDIDYSALQKIERDGLYGAYKVIAWKRIEPTGVSSETIYDTKSVEFITAGSDGIFFVSNNIDFPSTFLMMFILLVHKKATKNMAVVSKNCVILIRPISSVIDKIVKMSAADLYKYIIGLLNIYNFPEDKTIREAHIRLAKRGFDVLLYNQTPVSVSEVATGIKSVIGYETSAALMVDLLEKEIKGTKKR